MPGLSESPFGSGVGVCPKRKVSTSPSPKTAPVGDGVNDGVGVVFLVGVGVGLKVGVGEDVGRLLFSDDTRIMIG